MSQRSKLEYELQIQVVKALRDRGCLVFSVANERNAGIADALRMRASGLTKGAPDLMCWTELGHCWWLELKAPKGVRTPEQKCFEEIAKTMPHVSYKLVKSLKDVEEIV